MKIGFSKLAVTVLAGGLMMMTFILTPVSAVAVSSLSSDAITVTNKYTIEDESGTNTRYVLVATNATAFDISVEADFYAIGKDNSFLYHVSDFTDAVSAGQEFMIYGQFPNDIAEQTDHVEYSLSITAVDNCAYDEVDVTAVSMNGNTLKVEGTNYSDEDVQGVNIRTVFLKDGSAVGFNTVNIADSGYTLGSGNTNSQEIGQLVSDYDSYILTYTTCVP
ncbi:MAG: hypothetical protein K6A23_12920 [Butyrivibrio sp.]|nr:hypothetical protein [Butyrivibrio sp.]